MKINKNYFIKYKNTLSFLVFLIGSTSIFAQITPIDDGDCPPGSSEKVYRDQDGDGYGNPSNYLSLCTPVSGYVGNKLDCDDNNPNVNISRRWYVDADGDGYGHPSPMGFSSCYPPNDGQTYVTNNQDCDDSNSTINPELVWYRDQDNDGAGNPNVTLARCAQPSGYVSNKNDCDDNNPSLQGQVWYKDQDEDGLGDPNQSTANCNQPTTGSWVVNNDDQCPNYPGQASTNGCPGVEENVAELWNTITTTTYDINGQVTSKGKSYFDDLGKGVQSQSLDIETSKIWASESKYDSQGRPAFQTLSAPLNQNYFLYKDKLTLKANGDEYNLEDFETNPETPASVGAQQGSTGWYYSENNTSEPYQDITKYPFSRTIYSELNPGAVLKTIGGNKVDIDGQKQWLNGFSYTLPAAQELYYIFGKSYFGNGLEEQEVITKFYKSVAINVHGEETVVFTDGEGNTLAAGRSGGDQKYEVVSLIGEQGFIDVHIPKGITNDDIQLLGNDTYTIYDLRTEEPVAPLQLTGGHFYRISLTPQQYAKTFITPAGEITTNPDAKGIKYKVNYHDFSVNYYDKTGRLKETVQPLGFDDTALEVMLEAPDHQMKSTFTTNSLGQIVESTSPDEGAAKFMYREDGQIRYSQNTKQSENNEFSYTNYDSLGRPVESGVYKGSLSFGTSRAINSNPTDLEHVETFGNDLRKAPRNIWDSGIATKEMISGDGYIKWKVLTNDQAMVIGLSDSNTNYSYNTIDHAIDIRANGTIGIRYSGTLQSYSGTYQAEDIFRIRRAGSTLYFEKNGTAFFTKNEVSGNLLGDFAFLSPKAKVIDFEIGGSTFIPTGSPYTSLHNLVVNANQISKNAGGESWNASLITVDKISGDGYVEWTVDASNHRLMAGLSNTDRKISNSYGYINYALYQNSNGNLYIYEKGRYIKIIGGYAQGDLLRIERTGNIIVYKQNGNIVYTSTMPSANEELMGQVTINKQGSSVSNFGIHNADSKFIDYYAVAVDGNEIRKIPNFGWNAGFSSSGAIQNNGYVEFTIKDPSEMYMAGLSYTNENADYRTIDYALYIHHNQSVYGYEAGTYKGRISPTYKVGDKMRVERIDGVVRFYQNEHRIHTVEATLSTPSTRPLYIDSSLLTSDARISNLGLFEVLDTGSTVQINDTLNPDFCSERHLTLYDEPDTEGLHQALIEEGIPTNHYIKQSFVASNVSKTQTLNPNTAASWYSYDIYGRVQWMVQEIEGLGTKTIDYEYEPITGAVTKVCYQKHKPTERFIHKYTYNTVNQLVKVETSEDNVHFTEQASYEYYETGALKRTILAEGLQGIDYTYNLAGQLKQINHPSREAANDPGGDSNDAFGMAIDYYEGDYTRTNTPTPIASSPSGANQYNGNIKATRWSTQGINTPGTQNGQLYQYNNKNWLHQAAFGTANNTGVITTGQNYLVSNLTYDTNGNLLSLHRNKNTTTNHPDTKMDQLAYRYKPGTNQLDHVDDAVTGETNADDIKDQDAGNYEYNNIGQLVKNHQDKIEYHYNASGLVTSVRGIFDMNTNRFPQTVNFYYDDKGKRVRKETSQPNGIGGSTTSTYYVRDAAGSVMAVYSLHTNAGGIGLELGLGSTSSQPALVEHPIYGAGRIGVHYRQTNQDVYQLTDHLGNVRAVVGKTNTGDIDTKSASDYYPFGMQMPNRNLNGNYRYAYQGQEKDPETGKEAFQLRLWDGRIGRWLTTDPYRQFDSPYIGMGNNPVRFIDPDGGQCQDIKGNTIPCDQVFGGENYVGPTNETLTALNEVVIVWSKENNSIAKAYSLPYGTETSILGAGAAIAGDFIFNDEFWLGKNGKFNKANFNGNRFTGGKHKFARNLSKPIKVGGNVLSFYSIGATEVAYQNNEISEYQRNKDQIVNGIGFLGIYGAAFNFGYNSGYLIEDACNCNIQLNPNTFKKGYWRHRDLSFHNLFSDTYVPENSVFSE